MKKFEELAYRLHSIEALRILKKTMSYNELSSMLNMPPTALSRYVNGHVIPSLETARLILNIFKKKYLIMEVKNRIIFDEFGVLNNSLIIYDPVLLKYIILSEYERINSVKVDKVLTFETDGIPVAYQIASILGKEVAVAKKTKEIGVREFIEIKQVFNSGMYRYIYLPKNTIKRGDYVLLADDIIRTGATIKALINLCNKAKANVSGIFTVISLRKMCAKLEEELRVPVISFIELE
ncbi:helix-turn-helix domain-containing protein [Candidatus Methanodesulfokora washburnensis]|jgi:adenine phosphoribosyltransferase|uniref:Helix-turn-helix domain-containing protein n=1 Tax=Candidatus Methanodesulfokora washburnensis TaxID=2478471 RepID=A0A3R9PGF1_9CREN|nr:helix-turn-helix domain-containing protein [Candidatus Methanodesulfokores washburnensis]RSN75742.1 helix-turn-helix domain-containing protein [Candidatus Methanodesulfokores washburnensis]